MRPPERRCTQPWCRSTASRWICAQKL